jgi:hypothetical protein
MRGEEVEKIMKEEVKGNENKNYENNAVEKYKE